MPRYVVTGENGSPEFIFAASAVSAVETYVNLHPLNPGATVGVGKIDDLGEYQVTPKLGYDITPVEPQTKEG